jgi:hypothetical protein
MRARENDRMPVTAKTEDEARELRETIKAAVAQAITERENLKSDPDPIKVGSGSWTRFIFWLVMIAFLGSCIYNYVEMKSFNQPLDLTVAKRIDAMDVHLYTLQARVRAHRAAQGVYPASLAEIGVSGDPGLDYLSDSNREFYLSYRVGGVVRTYKSSETPGRLLQGEFTRSALRGRAPSS